MPLDDSNIQTALKYGIDMKPSTDNDVKEFRKKLRNRQSAQRARDRQKARMRWLEREVALLTVRTQALESENNTLRNLLGDGVCDTILRGRDPTGRDISQGQKKKNAKCASSRNLHDLSEPNTRNISAIARCQQKPHLSNGARNQSQSGSTERVAVISPMTRSDNRRFTAKSSPKQEADSEARLAKKAQHDVDGIENESIRNQEVKNADQKPMDIHMTEQALFAASNQKCGLPIAQNVVVPNYYPLLQSGYLSPYLQNMALAKLFPATTLQDGFLRGSESLGKRNREEQSTEVAGNKCTIPGAPSFPFIKHAPSPYFLMPTTSYSTLELLSSMPMGLRNMDTTGSDKVVKDESISVGKIRDDKAIKRQKMNSFESECSSQISSESDLYSPQC